MQPNLTQTNNPIHPPYSWLQTRADEWHTPKKTFHALLEHSLASVGRFCFRLTIAFILFSLGLSSSIWAQTEFQGEISGEWDTDGSPYIQVGNAQVPADESLTILPGVEVILGEDMTLTCNGHITAQGTEDDTIHIHGPEGVINGRLSIINEQDTVRFSFCRFDSLVDAIWSNNLALCIENCRFVNNSDHLDLNSRWVYVAHNHFTGSEDIRSLGNFNFGGIGDEEGTYILHNNEIQGIHTSIQFQVDVAEFTGNTAIPDPRGPLLPDLTFNNCREVICNNNTGWFPVFINNTFRGLRQAIFEDNDFRWITVYDQADWGVVIRNNRILHECSLHDGYAEYYDNIFGESNSFPSSISIFGFFTNAEAILERNILKGVRIGENSDVYMRNNTIDGCVMEYLRDDVENSRITLINNIFQNFEQRGYLILPEIGEISGGYNCFWGEEQPYGEDRDLLEGDHVQDPLMRGGLPYDYRLRADSPCIDAGDPDSPEDPDGTRADIGCYYFDQANGEPPALNRHWDYYIGWHETFRYAAEAVDEGDELDISFEGLPEWLEIEEDDGRRDFVLDSVVVSGEVPEDQEDFVFRVIATDDQDREDTLSVRVMVYPYRVLTGMVHGVLDIEQSPFIVADTAWVPAGDSLVLSPGTELFFDNREDTLADRDKSMLVIEGILRAVGTEEDSILLSAFDTDRDNLCVEMIPSMDAINDFRYCHLSRITFNSCVPMCNIQFRNCLLNNSSVRAGGYSTIVDISANLGHSGRIYAFGKASIFGNESIALGISEPESLSVFENRITGGRLSIWFGSRIETETRYLHMHHDEIVGGVNATTYYPIAEEYFDFRQNIVTEGQSGFEVTGWINSSITNNFIHTSGERSLDIHPFDKQTFINNNLLSNSAIGLYANYSRNYEDRFRPNFRVENNIFLSIDTLLYSYRNRTEGILFNSIFDFNFLSNDTTFDSRLVQVNANGDSCDANFNIYLDPRLANPDSLDFRLYSDSPLIDAGNPDSSFNDVDSTINDIGLYGGPYGMAYEYLDPNEVLSFDVQPRDFQVGNAYPNPFNATSHISLDIPYAGKTTFSLFDIQGRRVAHHSLQLTAGSHRGSLSEFLNTNLSGLRSGLYVLTVEFGRKSINRKLVLVK